MHVKWIALNKLLYSRDTMLWSRLIRYIQRLWYFGFKRYAVVEPFTSHLASFWHYADAVKFLTVAVEQEAPFIIESTCYEITDVWTGDWICNKGMWLMCHRTMRIICGLNINTRYGSMI